MESQSASRSCVRDAETRGEEAGFGMFLKRKIGKVVDRIIHVLLTAVICGLFTIAAAQDDVSGEAFRGSGLLRKREEKAARDIDRFSAQLDKTARALTRLGEAKDGELRNRYESFSRELNKLEEAHERAVTGIDKMKATGVEYFSSWEKANASISDAELKETASRRRSRSLMRHIDLAQTLGDIGLQVQPFMNRLRDLRTFLGADLAAANIRLAGERIREGQAEAQTLKSSIAEAQIRLKRLLNEMPG